MSNHLLRLSLCFVAALSLSILPMPEFITMFRPPWILLMLLYVEYFLPEYSRLTFIIVLGLVLDVLLSTVLGEHAFTLLLLTWIASSKSRRFQFFTMTQQMFLVGFFCLLYQAVITGIDAVLGFNYNSFSPLASGITGTFLWPWIRLLGQDTLLTRLAYR